MPNILDHVSSASLLEIDDLPRSATCKEWFAFTRRIIQDTIVTLNIDHAAEAEVIEYFTRAGLLSRFRSLLTSGGFAAVQALHRREP